MSEPALNGPGVVSFVGERVAAGMTEHVRMRLEFETSGSGGALHHSGEAGGRERGSPLADEDEGRRRALALEPAQRPEFIPVKRMSARGAALDPPDVEHRAVEVDLVPAEIADLGGPQAVPKGDQDLRSCVAQMSREHREVIDLVYYDDKSVAEVAEIIHLPKNTVKTFRNRLWVRISQQAPGTRWFTKHLCRGRVFMTKLSSVRVARKSLTARRNWGIFKSRPDARGAIGAAWSYMLRALKMSGPPCPQVQRILQRTSLS
jgi:hypothetical protein